MINLIINTENIELRTKVKNKTLIWVSFLILDIHLHKTSRIEILDNLSKRGYNVYLIAVSSKRKYINKYKNVNIITTPIRCIPIISQIIFASVIFFMLPYYILKLNPDYIVTEPGPSIFGFIHFPVLYHFRNFKIILDIRSHPVTALEFKGYVRTLFFNISVIYSKQFFNGITIITNSMKMYICDKFNINSNFIGVWTSGVSLNLFDPKKHLKESIYLRQKFGFNNKFIVFYHGNIGINRGIMEWIKSIKLIDENINIVYFILGEGHALPKIKHYVEKNGFQDRIFIHNPVDYDDVPKYIAMSNIGILTLPDIFDWRYQCPLKLLEYLSMQKAVILTDIESHREIVNKNKCVILIKTINEKEIAKAIMHAYEHQMYFNKMGLDGRKIVEERYSWEKIAKDFDDYVSNLN